MFFGGTRVKPQQGSILNVWEMLADAACMGSKAWLLKDLHVQWYISINGLRENDELETHALTIQLKK